MISLGINKKQCGLGNIQQLKGNRNATTMQNKQNTIKNYLLSKPSSIMITKNTQSNNFINNVQKTKSKQQHEIINDENCSYNSNITNRITEQFKCKTSQNIEQLHNYYEKQSDKSIKVIDLKKKIKKCHFSNPSYNFFREKVTFKKKIYTPINNQSVLQSNQSNQSIIDEHQKATTKQQHTIKQKLFTQKQQTFYVFRDTQVFISTRSRELINKIVIQRMDNDTQTDDEQVEKFVKRMSSDFLEHIQKVNSQNLSINSQVNSVNHEQQSEDDF